MNRYTEESYKLEKVTWHPCPFRKNFWRESKNMRANCIQNLTCTASPVPNTWRGL